MSYYHTGLVVKPSEIHLIMKICDNENEIKFIKDPTKRYWVTNDEHTMMEISSFKMRDEAISNLKLFKPCLELLIYAKSLEDAHNILSLMKSGIYLYSSCIILNKKKLGLDSPYKETKSSSKIIYSEKGFFDLYYCSNVDIGFFTYKKAYTDTKFIYALEKYKLSMDLSCIDAYSCHPKYGQVFDNISSIYEEHTTMLTSIVVAYSIIEELGLEIRASSENKRFIQKKPYTWNQKVWDDVLNRLEEAGIDASYKFQWTIRGEDTDIHKEFDYNYFGEPAKEGDLVVKDRMLHFIEAIQFAAYLRNYVAAHKLKELASQVSPYDVQNVQSLSRILLMQTLGIWDYIQRNNLY